VYGSVVEVHTQLVDVFECPTRPACDVWNMVATRSKALGSIRETCIAQQTLMHRRQTGVRSWLERPSMQQLNPSCQDAQFSSKDFE
jgi:hypothetical protein